MECFSSNGFVRANSTNSTSPAAPARTIPSPMLFQIARAAVIAKAAFRRALGASPASHTAIATRSAASIVYLRRPPQKTSGPKTMAATPKKNA